MIELQATYSETAEVAADPDEVFRLLADVPDSVAHFPDVAALEPGADGTYTWKLKKAGIGKASVQMIYGCAYERNAEARTIRWQPVEGVGNARVSGTWTVEPSPRGTRFTITNGFTLRLGLSRMFMPLAKPIVKRENSRMISTYMQNLVKTFSGADGRLR